MNTIILIHGAWHGSWCWSKTIPILKKLSIHPITFDLNSNNTEEISFNDSVKRLVELIKNIEGSVTLVAHSMGGIHASEAASRIYDKIKKIIYITGYIPDNNQSCLNMALKDSGIVPYGLEIDKNSNTALVNEAFIRPAFYNDLSDEDFYDCRSKIKPQSLEHYTAPVNLSDNFQSIPKYYIKCMRDHAITPGFQDIMASTHCKEIESLDCGHSPFINMPSELSELIYKFLIKIEN